MNNEIEIFSSYYHRKNIEIQDALGITFDRMQLKQIFRVIYRIF